MGKQTVPGPRGDASGKRSTSSTVGALALKVGDFGKVSKASKAKAAASQLALFEMDPAVAKPAKPGKSVAPVKSSSGSSSRLRSASFKATASKLAAKRAAPADSLREAEDQARQGMSQAISGAENVCGEDWPERAYDFLVDFAIKNARFISEDVSDASRGKLPQPPTDRAWGVIYRRAQKEAIIVKGDGVGRSRRRHGSICIQWESLVHKPPKASKAR
jgi:hypothetical protein